MKKRIALLLVCLLMLAGCAVKDTEETVTFHNSVFLKSDLSEDTLQWLEQYNSLTEEEQLAISYIPRELLCLEGIANGEDSPAQTD